MLLTLAQAKAHLRIDSSDSDADLTLKIEAAERSAAGYIERNIYEDESDLARAIAAVPAALVAAKATYVAEIAAAVAIEDEELSGIEVKYATDKYFEAKCNAARVRNGIVVNELILHGLQLYVEAAFDSRPECATAAEHLIHQYRCYA